jgi:hypothetical protein
MGWKKFLLLVEWMLTLQVWGRGREDKEVNFNFGLVGTREHIGGRTGPRFWQDLLQTSWGPSTTRILGRGPSRYFLLLQLSRLVRIARWL